MLLAVGLGIVELVSLPFGGIGTAPAVLLGLFVVIAALGIAAAVGRRRRDRAKAASAGSARSRRSPRCPEAAAESPAFVASARTTLAPCLRPPHPSA